MRAVERIKVEKLKNMNIEEALETFTEAFKEQPMLPGFKGNCEAS